MTLNSKEDVGKVGSTWSRGGVRRELENGEDELGTHVRRAYRCRCGGAVPCCTALPLPGNLGSTYTPGTVSRLHTTSLSIITATTKDRRYHAHLTDDETVRCLAPDHLEKRLKDRNLNLDLLDQTSIMPLKIQLSRVKKRKKKTLGIT